MSTVALPSDEERAKPDFGFGSKEYRAYVLGILLLVYIFNFIDRTIINILTEPIKETFKVEDWQMGLLGGPAFAILYTFLGIPIARIAERHNRVWIITLAISLWSLMTAFCGIAASFFWMFVFRVGVSIGEAGCTPPAQSLISDYFRTGSRSAAASIYAMGVPLGAMFAAVFAGFIAQNLDGDNVYASLVEMNLLWLANLFPWEGTEGWRIAFILVGIPGLLVGLIVKLTITEPPRGYTDPSHLQKTERASFSEAIRYLITKPTYVHVVLGATIASFVGYGIGQFSTSFLIRTHNLDLQSATLLYGVILGIMAAIGVFSSGWFADKWAQKYPNALSWLPALGMGLSVPIYAIGFWLDNLWIATPFLMVAAMIHYYYLGPMYAVAAGVTDSRMRATSVAITLFVVNILGYGLGPPIIGYLSTILKSAQLSGSELNLTLETCRNVAELQLSELQIAACDQADANGLQWSIIIFVCFYGWAALHYLIAGRTLQRDMLTLSKS